MVEAAACGHDGDWLNVEKSVNRPVLGYQKHCLTTCL